MGLFDIFTGDSIKDAANQNKDLYTSNKAEGLGYLNSGTANSRDALYHGIQGYTPLATIGSQYGAAPTMLLNALGVNGAPGTAAARSAFQASPGYNFQLGQGLQAIDRGAAARGTLNSGNTLMAEQKYGSDLANQEYGNWLTNLAGFTYPTISATSGAAAGQNQGYTNLGNLYQNDATNRVNLANTTTSALANANMQAAQAETQGSGNLFSFGMNLGKMALGFA